MVSDRDSRFTGKFWRELFKLLGTELKFSTSFHPQSNGQTEWVNVVLELYLRHYVSAHQQDWTEPLNLAQFSYNLQRSESNGKSPFEIVTGQQPLTPSAIASTYGGSSPIPHKLAREWHENFDIMRFCLDKATRRMKKRADAKRRPMEYSVGETVMVKFQLYQFKSL